MNTFNSDIHTIITKHIYDIIVNKIKNCHKCGDPRINTWNAVALPYHFCSPYCISIYQGYFKEATEVENMDDTDDELDRLPPRKPINIIYDEIFSDTDDESVPAPSDIDPDIDYISEVSSYIDLLDDLSDDDE